MRAKRIAIGAGIALVLVGVAAASAGLWMGRARPEWNAGADGVVLSGYDPVAYFPEGGGRPRAGDETWTAERDGRRYRFASPENRKRFLADPERYEPEFGGWCAYAVAHGYKFEIDPESYRIQDDRLLLFYRGAMGDAQAEFEKEGAEQNLRTADQNWPTVRLQ